MQLAYFCCYDKVSISIYKGLVLLAKRRSKNKNSSIVIITFLAFAISVCLAFAGSAQAMTEGLSSYISSPLYGVYSGSIVIKGSATHINPTRFSKYALMYQKTHTLNGVTVTSPVWSPVSSSSSPVSNSVLGTWNTKGLSGTFNLRLITYDIYGNAAVSVKQFDLDNDKPVFSSPSPLAGSTIISPQPVAVYVGDSMSGIENVGMMVNERPVNFSYTPETGYLVYLPLQADLIYGKNAVSVFAADIAGNRSSYSYIFNFDPLEPLAVISNLEDEAVIPGVKKTSIAGKVFSPTIKSWKLDYKKETATAYSQLSSSVKSSPNEIVLGSLPVLTSGSYRLRLTAFNSALVATVREIHFAVDNNASYSQSAAITDAYQQGNNLIILGSAAAQNFASYKLVIKPTYPAGPEQFLFSGTSTVNDGVLFNGPVRANGTYTVILRTYDSSGTVINTFNYEGMRLDTTVAKITWTSPAANSYVKNPVSNISIGASDPEPVNGAITSSGLMTQAVFRIAGADYGAGLLSSSYSLNFPEALEDGIHKVYASVEDNARNKTAGSFSFVIDTEYPNANIDNLFAGQTVKGIYSVTGVASDMNLANYQLQVRPDSPSGQWLTVTTATRNVPISGSVLSLWNTSALNGWYYVRLVVTDKAGNATYYPEGSKDNPLAAIKVLADNKAPAYSSIIPIDKSHNKSVGAIIVSGAYDLNAAKTTDNTSGINSSDIKMKVNGESISEFEYVGGKIIYEPAEGLVDGTYNVQVSVPDNAGSLLTVKSSFTVDSTMPAAEITLARTAVKSGNKLTIAGKATDKNMASWILFQKLSSKETYNRIASGSSSIGNEAYKATLFTWISPVVSGAYDLLLQANDKAGNTTIDVESIEVNDMSTYSDTAEITFPPAGMIVKGKVPIIGTAAVPSNFAFYTISRRLVSSAAETVVYKGSSPVEGGTLASFNTAGLNGAYELVVKRFVNPGAPIAHGSPTMASNIIIDNTMPAITSFSLFNNAGQPGFSKYPVSVVEIKIRETGTGVDLSKTRVAIDSVPIELDFGEEGNASFSQETNTIYVTLPSLLDWKYNLTASVSDKAGNVSNPLSMVLTVDTNDIEAPLAPNVQISDPVENSYQKGAIPVVGSAFDQNILNYQLSGRKEATGPYTLAFTGMNSVISATLGSYKSTDNGLCEIKLSMQDKAANEPKSTSVKVILDNTVPVATVARLGATAAISVTQVTGSVAITGKAYDRGGLGDTENPNDSFDGFIIDYGSGTAPASWTSFALSDEPIGNETAEGLLGTWNTTGLIPGTYTLRLRVFDKAGGIKEFKKALKVI